MRLMLVLIGLVALQSRPDAGSGNWPHWRGPTHDGVSRETGLPVSWGAQCADAPATGEPAASSTAATPDPAAAPPQGRQGRAGGRGGGGREGRPIVSVSCAKIDTTYGPERLPPGTYSASPILADGKIYITTEEEGLTTVFRAGPKFEILSSNSLLGDCSPCCLSTVAISDGQLFFRTSSFLWAIGERRSAATR